MSAALEHAGTALAVIALLVAIGAFAAAAGWLLGKVQDWALDAEESQLWQ